MAKHYPAHLTLTDDGRLYVRVERRDGQMATNTFTPAKCLSLREWLANAEWSPIPGWLEARHAAEVLYSHSTGKIILNPGAHKKEQHFDPNSEEDLAKLVRLLKSLAPIPRGEPILPNVLPAPTEAELARRQVFLNAAPAIGYDGQALRKRALAPGKLDKEESKRRLREMRDLMFSARQT